ncbi:hypothetical protein LSTR_LSTR007519 [Laodelphax striatellus]|uniref:Translation initiation factor eIF2B subunit gamma n=1 Tax=Laodelphax striatellus TaxID=195883 RepID=A0A482XQW2_LAOST|nr:hypothetical protein LSTR_LSTR007519 [Laodelphax striatellus]
MTLSFSEFQAVVMAGGKGSRMTELTAENPKCLLPVGNLPLLWYPLQLLERSNFQEAIVVVAETFKAEIQSTYEQYSQGKNKLSIKVEFIGIPAVDDWGTADSLRHLYESNRIKRDVVVVSCDLITDINLINVLDLFRKHNSSLTSLFFGGGIPKYTSIAPGSKEKKPERDLIGIDPLTSRLVLVASSSDYDNELPLSQALLRKHGKIQIHSKLLDGHLYIMKHWVCQYLASNKSISTIKGELLPYIVKKQIASKNASDCDKQETEKNIDNSDLKTDINSLSKEDEWLEKIRDMSSYSDHTGDWFGPYHGDHIRCYAHIESEESFGARVNTVSAYCYVNREVKKRWSNITRIPTEESSAEATDQPLKGTAKDFAETCLVGEQVEISPRTHIISTNIGADSKIASKSKIVNCIIMPGVKIGEKCDLKNCIIFDEASVEDDCCLVDCIVGKRFIVPTKERQKSKVLTDIDHLMEI